MRKSLVIYLTMSDKFFIPDLMHYLRSCIKGCHICQLSNKDKIPNRHFQRRINLNYKPLSRLSMDLKVMQKSYRGHKFILCVIDEMTNYLITMPIYLKGLVQQYKQKSKMLDEAQNNKPNNEFFDNIAVDIFLYAAIIISMLTVAAIMHPVCKHSKLKALLTGIAFQSVNQAEPVVTKQAKEFCSAQWYAIAALTVLTIFLIIYICLSNQNALYSKEDSIQIQ